MKREKYCLRLKLIKLFKITNFVFKVEEHTGLFYTVLGEDVRVYGKQSVFHSIFNAASCIILRGNSFITQT